MQMDLRQQGTHDVLKATGNIYKLGYWAKNANPTSLDIMRNINKEKILKEGTKQQKWKKRDLEFMYWLYSKRCPKMKHGKVFLVMMIIGII